jgi:Zn-dependent alcohol dehydrogenase
MKAAVLHEIGKPLVIEELDIEPPREHEVGIKIAASGICHSDYSVAHGVLLSPLPVVLGHEAAGVVEAVGPGVTDLEIGDHVIASLSPSCDRCVMCGENKPFLCSQMGKVLNESSMLDGTTRLRRGIDSVHQMAGIASFAERAVIPAGAAIKIRKDVPLETVCLIGCGVTTGTGAALNTAKIESGDTVAVVGCGGVGLSIIQGARIAGASIIVAVDPIPEKRELALSLGATHGVDPFAEDAPRAVRKITGLGAHHAFEALGKLETIEAAYKMLRPTGTAIVVGMPPVRESVPVRVGGLFLEKKITGSAYGSAVPRRDIPKFVDYYKQGVLKLDEMITKRIPLEAVNEAFEEMGRGEGARSVIVYD